MAAMKRDERFDGLIEQLTGPLRGVVEELTMVYIDIDGVRQVSHMHDHPGERLAISQGLMTYWHITDGGGRVLFDGGLDQGLYPDLQDSTPPYKGYCCDKQFEISSDGHLIIDQLVVGVYPDDPNGAMKHVTNSFGSQ